MDLIKSRPSSRGSFGVVPCGVKAPYSSCCRKAVVVTCFWISREEACILIKPGARASTSTYWRRVSSQTVYLSDVLEFLNVTNRNKQIKNEIIHYSTDKIHGFRGKMKLRLHFIVSGSTVFSSGADKTLLCVAEHICEPWSNIFGLFWK
jgi:hypothetical protein